MYKRQYQNTLIENVKGLKEILPDVYNEVGEVQLKAIKEISTPVSYTHLSFFRYRGTKAVNQPWQ